MYADFLTFRLDQTSALLVERANALYRERWGLDVRSLRVLRLVCSEPGVTPKAISQRTLIEKTLLSKTLAALASRGLIERRAHACDGRQFALHATPEGRASHGHRTRRGSNSRPNYARRLRRANARHSSACSRD